MGTSRVNQLRDSSYIIRPALVEAKLMTEKQGRDEVYVVTLKEELQKIESMIAEMEKRLQLDSPQGDGCIPAGDGSNTNWIRTKSNELNLRFKRIAQADACKQAASYSRGNCLGRQNSLTGDSHPVSSQVLDGPRS
jgi:hypothetical protein